MCWLSQTQFCVTHKNITMTYIEISGSDESLEELKLLSEEVFRDNGIQAKPRVSHFVQDSVDVEQLLPTLQVAFSGVIAVVQVINLVINIQEKRRETSANDNTPFRIKIKASNGRNLNLEFSGKITEERIKFYQKLVQDFINEFLSVDDGRDLRKLGSPEIAEINSLFKRLETELTDIRILVSSPPKNVGDVTIFPFSFEKINLTEAIKIGAKETFYLKIDDTKCCKNIFYILERENILSFHEESTNIRVLQMGNELVGFVGYRIELLSLFEEVVDNGSFDLHDRFQSDKQYNDKIREKEREIEIYRQHNFELSEIAKSMASQPINIKTNSTMEIQIMSADRHIHTEGGNYIESNSGVYIQGNYIDMNQDLTQAATQIQDLIEHLKKGGMTDDFAQEQVAKDIANQAQKNSTVKDKLVKWGQSLGEATVSDVVKGAVKLAIRSAGIPLP
jgi:hypothetical protein